MQRMIGDQSDFDYNMISFCLQGIYLLNKFSFHSHVASVLQKQRNTGKQANCRKNTKQGARRVAFSTCHKLQQMVRMTTSARTRHHSKHTYNLTELLQCPASPN